MVIKECDCCKKEKEVIVGGFPGYVRCLCYDCFDRRYRGKNNNVIIENRYRSKNNNVVTENT